MKDLKEELIIIAGQITTSAAIAAWAGVMLVGLVIGAFSED